jgi:DMSO/TMAO reductase YedYZ molybdopterin-dependent catalytic subunit
MQPVRADIGSTSQWRAVLRVSCAVVTLLAAYSSWALDPAHANKAAQRADSVAITGEVEHSRSLSLADLKSAPATTVTVSLKTGKGMLTGSYTGVLLWDLLQQAGIKTAAGKNEIIRRTVVVTSSDGYATVLSAAEIDPEFGGEQAIIAYAKDGQPLSDARGFARLILPADKEAARAISGVASITVR